MSTSKQEEASSSEEEEDSSDQEEDSGYQRLLIAEHPNMSKLKEIAKNNEQS